MDLTDSIAPNSQQVNADDLISGSRVVTIAHVEEGSAEQPAFFHLAEFPGRTYRPSKTMRRIIVAAWGADSKQYTGRRMELFRNPEVTFGREKVGGIQISALSDIAKPMLIALAVSRGKRAPFKVEPLADRKDAVNPVDALGQALTGSRTLSELQAAWGQVTAAGHGTNPVLVAAKDARKTELAGADIGEKEPA